MPTLREALGTLIEIWQRMSLGRYVITDPKFYRDELKQLLAAHPPDEADQLRSRSEAAEDAGTQWRTVACELMLKLTTKPKMPSVSSDPLHYCRAELNLIKNMMADDPLVPAPEPSSTGEHPYDCQCLRCHEVAPEPSTRCEAAYSSDGYGNPMSDSRFMSRCALPKGHQGQHSVYDPPPSPAATEAPPTCLHGLVNPWECPTCIATAAASEAQVREARDNAIEATLKLWGWHPDEQARERIRPFVDALMTLADLKQHPFESAMLEFQRTTRERLDKLEETK